MAYRRIDIYAVDFDGTLCENKFPQIGEPIQGVIDFVKEKQAQGHKIILWTCRSGLRVEQAVDWCKEQGIIFDAVNEQLPEVLESFELDCRKVFANHYIDDRNYFWGDINEN